MAYRCTVVVWLCLCVWTCWLLAVNGDSVSSDLGVSAATSEALIASELSTISGVDQVAEAVSSHWLAVTTRHQFMQSTGRIRWATMEQTELWDPKATAIIVVDMWDQHWCPSTTERVQSLAPLINDTLNEARKLGVQIIHAPSQCDAYYANHPSREWVLELTNYTLPDPLWHNEPTLPLDASDGGCDVAQEHKYLFGPRKRISSPFIRRMQSSKTAIMDLHFGILSKSAR